MTCKILIKRTRQKPVCQCYVEKTDYITADWTANACQCQLPMPNPNPIQLLLTRVSSHNLKLNFKFSKSCNFILAYCNCL
jgi:hypothetical protein